MMMPRSRLSRSFVPGSLGSTCIGRRTERLFEPDGTLYAIALSDRMTVMTERRGLAIGRGDALVVPQAVALDIEPEVDLLGIRHDGPPPDHFRERFIQVWGFEHVPAPPLPLSEAPGGLTEVIAAQDVRFRIPYAIWDLPAGSTEVQETGLETVLLIGLEGTPRLIVAREDSCVTLRPGTIAAIGPGLSFQAEGMGRLGWLTLRTELAHEARRRDRDRAAHEPMSPEYRPEPPRSEPSLK